MKAKISAESYGSQHVITVQSDSAETTAIEVNHLVNYGLMLSAALPEIYNPDIHTKVSFAVTTARIVPALAALEERDMIDSGESKRYKRNPDLFKAETERRAKERFASFDKAAITFVEDDQDRGWGLYEVPASDRSPEWERGKKLLTVFNQARSVAKSTERKNQE